MKTLLRATRTISALALPTLLALSASAADLILVNAGKPLN